MKPTAMKDHNYTHRVVTRSTTRRRKTAADGKKRRCWQQNLWARETRSSRPGLFSLPNELLLEIMSYLGPRDLQTMRRVSPYLEQVVNDSKLWKAYEIWNNEMSTSDIIQDLKRMPLLKKIRIDNREDCDDILRQISLSNKNLEQLHIANCKGSSLSPYLRPGYLTRIMQRCQSLHTFSAHETRFRGLKFYRLLGTAGPRLRAVSATTTRAQFETFVRHVSAAARAGLVVQYWKLTNKELFWSL